MDCWENWIKLKAQKQCRFWESFINVEVLWNKRKNSWYQNKLVGIESRLETQNICFVAKLLVSWKIHKWALELMERHQSFGFFIWWLESSFESMNYLFWSPPHVTAHDCRIFDHFFRAQRLKSLPFWSLPCNKLQCKNNNSVKIMRHLGPSPHEQGQKPLEVPLIWNSKLK